MYSCWNLLGNGAGRSVGNIAFLCDDFRHLFDSCFSWPKVRLFLHKIVLFNLLNISDHFENYACMLVDIVDQ